MFFEHANVSHGHATIDRLAHIVNGQQADLNRRQRFHFDTGLTVALDGGDELDGNAGLVDRNLDGDPGQADRMAQRNQIGRAFGGLNGGNSRDTEDIAFFDGTAFDEFKRCRLHGDATTSHGHPMRFELGADIDHVRLSVLIEMAQFIAHCCSFLLDAHYEFAPAGAYKLLQIGFRYHTNMHLSSSRAPRALAVWILTASLLSAPSVAVNAQSPPPERSSGTDTGRGSQISNLPRLGDAGSEELPPGTERRIGEAIMRDFRRERALLDDVELSDYLNRFAGTLTETSAAQGFSFEFFLVRDPSMNAFAMPGGFIGVHTGLITASSSESELASVLAHEIGHVTQRHIARMLATQRQSSVLQMAALVLGALAARSNPQAAVGLATLGASAQQQIMLSFSRDAEREADRVGIEMLRGAGFDPIGMVGFFTRLQQATRVYEGNAPSYLRTHPLTSERIADMQARIREERYRQRADSLEFTLARTKLSALADLSIDGLAAAKLRFERQLKERNALDDRAAMYGLALITLAQRDFAGSEKALADLRKRLPNGHPFIERLAVEGRLARGDANGAAQMAEAALQRFPQARALNHLRAQALIDLREYDRAVGFLEDQLTLYRSDATLWRLLALAQGARGRQADAHRASAEEYALIGGWLAAIDQLRLAQRVGSLDFYAASQVDSRVREIQAQYTIEQQDRR